MEGERVDELNKQAAADIIKALELYVEAGITEDSSKIAEYAYLKYFSSVSYLSDFIYEAKLKLFPIAYPDAEVSVSMPTQDEAASILEELRKI